MPKLLTLFACFFAQCSLSQVPFRHDLQFTSLAKSWDEALPMGNGMVGNLIWQKDSRLRFSLDRADLWDLRPMKGVDQLTWKLIQQQVAKNDYQMIQNLGDLPYEREAAPSKIPGAAIEFDISALGEVSSTHLYIKEGLAEVHWKSGAKLTTFIHPDLPVGWFRFEQVELIPTLVPPRYSGDNSSTGNSVEGQGLARLGYAEGSVTRNGNTISYRQPGWNGFNYQVSVAWRQVDGGMEGTWSLTSNAVYNKEKIDADAEVKRSLDRGYKNDREETVIWWTNFWNESSLTLPDSILERQWYLDNYKFGCVARSDSPPITLQAIWTADNGNLPPWKGDIHNDLNTQLSYWPAYSGNHLKEARGFTNWLWSMKPVFEHYTKRFFNVAGLAVPGVTTLDGKDMGGWVQYSYSPTVAGWLAQHFYLEWRYSMDSVFLREKAYPWIKDVARFFENISLIDSKGKRRLPLSSSPEFYDNTIQAWFKETTNYDLAIIRWNYLKAAELAAELGLEQEALHWKEQLSQWPPLSLDQMGSLALAPGIPYPASHRHFSHLLGFHPLGILDYSLAPDKKILEASMKLLEEKGTNYWVGYSFSWQANMYARMMNGNKAAEALRTFATCFCLPNSFHVNGDQCNGKFSTFRYRPFTLEGNFASASAVQEMLIQSYGGIIKVFPAIPETWGTVSFDKLRVEGAFIISAIRENGKTKEIRVTSEHGGSLILENPFDQFILEGAVFKKENRLIKIQTIAGQQIVIRAN